MDDYSGKNYEHRRDWVESRLLFLASVFAIDICAYAVMTNHLHVVLHVDKAQAERWSIKEVLIQWHKIHHGTLLTQKYLNGDALSKAEVMSVHQTALVYRQRLFSISWFMRNLNEYIARAANKEDECTGRFWEGRFKSQALLDDKALLTCMAYVDLNPVRAKLASTPEDSSHTSIQQRTHAMKSNKRQPSTLMPFVESRVTNSLATEKSIPFHLADYCHLVDTTARVMRQDKRGHITSSLPPLLERLGISDDHWLILTTEFERCFCYAAGTEQALLQFKQRKKQQRFNGIHNARRLFQHSYG
jgi:REP element-mobilizing transposase RayT